MASTRQLKHHARFHAAVLRYLFPPSPPDASSRQEAAGQSCEEVCFQAQSPKCAEVFAEEKSFDHEDDSMETGKALLSRAQRKRLKLKKLKEEQSGAMPAKRFIGPFLPDVLEKRRLEVVDCQSALLQDHDTSEKFLTLLNSKDTENKYDKQDDGFLTAATNMQNARELESAEKDGHDRAETEPVSKAKRRRLAKKKFQDGLQRYPRAGSSFTTEIKGGDIVIKQML